MTIRELAKSTSLSSIAISNLESGKTNPALPNLRLLAQVLNVPIAFLGCFETLPENTLGQQIKKARLMHGLTKLEMAGALGINVRTLRTWENDNHVPIEKHLHLLNEYLKILDAYNQQ